MKPEVTAFFDEVTNTISYVVTDPSTKKCAVVDSVLDYDPNAGRTDRRSADQIIDFVRKHGLEVESGTEHFRNILRHEVITSERVLSLRVDESLYFANTRYLEDEIYDLAAARPKLEHVVLMCPAVNFIDASALESLEAIVLRLKAVGVTFHLSEVKGPVMDRLQRSRFLSHLTGEVFLSQYRAMARLDPETTCRAAQAALPGATADIKVA